MSDISSVKLPSGEVYNIKDIEVRKALEELLGKKNIKVPQDEQK